MNANDFLRAVAAVMPGRPSASRASALAQMAPRLRADFSDTQLTPEAADAVGAALMTFPTYHELADQVRLAVSAGPAQAGQQPSSEESRWHSNWLRFVADSATPAQTTIRLSVARTYGAPGTWDALLALYRSHIARFAPHWLPVDPAERAAHRLNPPKIEALLRAAPPPRGQTVATRPMPDAPRWRKEISPETLAAIRSAAAQKAAQ